MLAHIRNARNAPFSGRRLLLSLQMNPLPHRCGVPDVLQVGSVAEEPTDLGPHDFVKFPFLLLSQMVEQKTKNWFNFGH